MKLTIKRDKWLRGRLNSALYDSDSKKMCCLGFFARECGLSQRAIRDIGSPSSVSFYLSLKKKPKKIFYRLLKDSSGYHTLVNNNLCRRLMKINDNRHTSDEEKEKQIKKNFKKIDVEVKFID